MVNSSWLTSCQATQDLTLKDPFISESCIEIKMALKAFIKPFEATQRSVKIKI